MYRCSYRLPPLKNIGTLKNPSSTLSCAECSLVSGTCKFLLVRKANEILHFNFLFKNDV